VVPAAAALTRSAFAGPVEIDLFFPVPVQGKLADKMKELIDRFNGQQSAVKATAVYTGSYDDTNLKTRAAIKPMLARAHSLPAGSGMMLLSTGSLSFVRDNIKSPYKVAFCRRACAMPLRSAALRSSCRRAIRRSARLPHGR
jgi:hypothetical protein